MQFQYKATINPVGQQYSSYTSPPAVSQFPFPKSFHLCIVKYTRGIVDGRMRKRSHTRHHVEINPFRTAVPFLGQSSQSLSNLSPKRYCSPKRVQIKLCCACWDFVRNFKTNKKSFFNLFFSRGITTPIVNWTYGVHKNLPGIYFTIFTNNIWSC